MDFRRESDVYMNDIVVGECSICNRKKKVFVLNARTAICKRCILTILEKIMELDE